MQFIRQTEEKERLLVLWYLANILTVKEGKIIFKSTQ